MTVKTVVSRKPGEVRTLAREAAIQGYGTVIAVGGDGTIHEAVNGLYDADPALTVALGVVPAGTGMDFARNLALSRGIAATAATLAGGESRTIDLGMLEGQIPRLFVNFAEIGLGAAIVAREARFGPAWPGRMSFLLAALGAAVRENNINAAIEVEGERVYDGPLVSAVVANGSCFGGGMKVAPRASVRDGELDVLIFGDFSRAQLVAQIWKIYPGTHVDHPKVLWLRGRSVRVLPRSETRLDLDGELHAGGAYTFSVLPAALSVIAPSLLGKKLPVSPDIRLHG